MATPPWVKTREGYQLNSAFPRLPAVVPQPYARLTHRCLDHNSRNRPDFAAIVVLLGEMHAAFLAGHDTLCKPGNAAGAAAPAAAAAAPFAAAPAAAHPQMQLQQPAAAAAAGSAPQQTSA